MSDTRHFRHFRRFRGSEERGPWFGGPLRLQIQEYCLARGSWSTVGPLASALQEGPKPYSCLPNQQRGSPSWKQSKRPPRRQANRTA